MAKDQSLFLRLGMAVENMITVHTMDTLTVSSQLLLLELTETEVSLAMLRDVRQYWLARTARMTVTWGDLTIL